MSRVEAIERVQRTIASCAPVVELGDDEIKALVALIAARQPAGLSFEEKIDDVCSEDKYFHGSLYGIEGVVSKEELDELIKADLDKATEILMQACGEEDTKIYLTLSPDSLKNILRGNLNTRNSSRRRRAGGY